MTTFSLLRSHIRSNSGLTTRVGSKAELEKQVAAYQTTHNTKPTKINWQFTSKDARVKLKQLYPLVEP